MDAFKEAKLDVGSIALEEFERELFLSFGFEPEAIDIMTFTKGITYAEVSQNAVKVSMGTKSN